LKKVEGGRGKGAGQQEKTGIAAKRRFISGRTERSSGIEAETQDGLKVALTLTP